MSRSTYNRRLRKEFETVVRCPSCLERLALKEYVKEHALARHGLNFKVKCLFCLGEKRWQKGRRDFKHVVFCMRRFIDLSGVESEEATEREQEEGTEREQEEGTEREQEETDVSPCSECSNFRSVPREMFGRTRDRLSEYVGFYESVFERPDQYSSDIEFSEESGLGRDLYGIVQRFLREDLKWYHLMVVHQNFYNFVNAMREMRDRMFLLPYWCLCDGLTKERKTHRHMIIAYEPEAPFEHLWRNKVRYEFEEGGNSKYSVRIKDAFHLIRTIQYVSQRKSSCDGKQIRDAVADDFALSHFHMNRRLHEHTIAFMSTTFEGGMEKLLREQNRNKDVAGWFQSVERIRDVHGHARFAVPVGETGFPFQNCVLPLARRYEPTEEKTDLFLTLLGSKKLYLRANSDLENVSREAWLGHQVAKGNTLRCLRRELYVLSPRQQNVMKQIKVIEKQTRKMEKNRWEKKYRELETKCATLRAEKAKLEKEREDWRQKMRKLKSNLMLDQNTICMKYLREIFENEL